jgi:TPR repeat protein
MPRKIPNDSARARDDAWQDTVPMPYRPRPAPAPAKPVSKLPGGWVWAPAIVAGLLLLAWAGYARFEQSRDEQARRRTEEVEMTATYGSVEAGRAVMAEQTAKRENSDFGKTLAAAQRGDIAAQYQLGQMYRDGKVGPQISDARVAAALRPGNNNQAAIWFRTAAERGHAPSQNALGLMYMTGGIAAPDPLAQAAAWFGKAAAQGDAAAQINLGQMLTGGSGIAKDFPRAIALLRQAAEQGQRSALSDLGSITHNGFATVAERNQAAFVLGQLYLQGRGIPKDERQAAEWFAKLVKQGYAPALEWLRKTADRGDVSVQYILGQIYLGQHDGPKDEAQAAAWLRKAAERGYAPAQNLLGALYASGQGVAKDEAEARAWYGKAIAQGSLEAQYGLRQMDLRARNTAPLASITDAQPEALNQAARAIWEQRDGRREYTGVNREPASRLCVRMPSAPAPDARSQARNPMAWHIDFLTGGAPNEKRDQALRQLNALAQAGLLKKQDATLTVNGESKSAARYRLSEQGWAASGGDSNALPCFLYGTARYLGMSRFAPRAAGGMGQGDAPLQLMEVHAKVGLGSAADLAPWAREPAFQAEFPEIRKNLDGQDVALLLARRGNDLVDYFEAASRQKNPGQVDQSDPALLSIRAEMRRAQNGAGDLPPPTVDEIKKLLDARHGAGMRDPSPANCLYLPGGSSPLPVDKRLNQSSQYRPYSVAIFLNKERGSHDRVTQKTVPYLNTLHQLGILSKRTEAGVPGENRDAARVFDADIYELAPAYVTLIHPRYECFALGAPALEFVDVQIFEKGDFSSADPVFTYKFKVLYQNPPAWMNNPALKNGWSDLKGALDHGKACDGRFHFDNKKREFHSGMGSCWWAFDSHDP